MTEGYHIPASRHRTEIHIQKSRFLTTVEYVTTVVDARKFISDIRDEMPDANHHVYAFRIGYGNSVIEGMSDDGEPKGTSGPPTLATLRGSNLGDIALVTTRYFGGKKLGTGGLVRAYTESAQEALQTLPTTIKVERQLIGIELPYHLHDIIKRLVNDHNGTIKDENFAESIIFYVEFLQPQIQPFASELQEKTSGQVSIVFLE